MDNKRAIRNLAVYLGIPILIIIIISTIYINKPQQSYNYSEIVNYFATEQVTQFNMDLGTGDMSLTLNDEPKTVISYTAPNVGLMYEDIKPYIDSYNANHPDSKMVYNLGRPQENSWLTSMLPTIILFVLMGLFWWFMMKKLSSGIGADGKQMSFGKAKIKNMSDEKRKTTFKNVAGADEEKEELKEIVEFLKDPKKYNALGARIPKGVLLVGPPGTGKTLLASHEFS